MRTTSLVTNLPLALVLIFIATTVATGSAQTPPPKPLSAFDQELSSAEARFMKAQQEKDVAYAERIVAPDFQGVALNGDSFDRGEIIGNFHDGLSKDARTYDLQIVRVSDHCAVVTYSQILPGEHPRYRQISDTWVKEGAEWKLKFQHRTPRLWSALDLD